MHGHASTHSTPRWVKVFGIAIIALLVVFVGVHLIGRNPLGHMFGGHGDHTPPPSATEHRLQRP